MDFFLYIYILLNNFVYEIPNNPVLSIQFSPPGHYTEAVKQEQTK